MLEIIIIILIILWLVGGFAIPAAGALLNILLAVAVIVLVVRLIKSA